MSTHYGQSEAKNPALQSKAGRSAISRWYASNPDEAILRTVFFALIAVTFVVIGLDARERFDTASYEDPATTPYLPDVEPYLPSSRPDIGPDGAPAPGESKVDLTQAMTFELRSEGRLEATGTITPGSADRLAGELEKRGEYVKSVVLNSPGGAVNDALAMSRIIREKKLPTRVDAGARCASSCPLVFAGGTERIASKAAFIGVHQVFAMARPGDMAGKTLAEGMASAQHITAECQRLLADMGIDLRVWIHAMDTPPQKIFYFTAEELKDLKLATKIAN